MSHTYTISNTTANSGTITLNTGAGVGGLTNQPLGNITITGGGNGGAGQIYTTTGTGTSNWITPNNYDQVLTVNAGKSHPTLEVKGNLVINGVDLEERLKTIERVLTIPERDVKLEKKHPKLKKLYDEYINALGKYRTFDAIKGEDE
jgi:hypothetical protein